MIPGLRESVVILNPLPMQKKNIVEMENYRISYFSIICDDFLLQRYKIQKHIRLISTPEPRTGFMKNGTVTHMHQRVQLRSDLTNPYVK